MLVLRKNFKTHVETKLTINIYHCSYLYSAVVGDDLYLTCGAGSECWREVHYDAQFSGYCVMSVCEAQPSVVAIGNLKGCIKLLTFSDKG